MADQLSYENILEILSRMPVKSLAQIRCVSKPWRSYVNDPYLENMHAKRATSTDPTLIMFHLLPSYPPSSQCIVTFLEYTEKADTFTVEVTKKPPVMEFMCTDWGSRYPNDIILGSCNGLVYSSQRHHDVTNLVVINPLRRECYELPPIKSPFHYSHTQWGVGLDQSESNRLRVSESSGLGFDESTNTFKMVCVVLREQEYGSGSPKMDLFTLVHVLGTGSWRKIAQVPSFPISGEGVFVNGCLHWLISDGYDDYRESYLGRAVITFDVAEEEFGLINPPQELPSGWVKEQLVDLNGELGYVYNIVNRSVEVWVLKEGGWVVHCKFEQKPPLPPGLIKVLGFWNENGDVLMTDISKRMFVYNLKSGGLYEVSFVGWEKEHAIDIRIYQSSLFSTRYSIKN